MDDNDFPYTPELVREILRCLPQIDGVKAKGTLVLTPTKYHNDSIESKMARERISQQMWPTPKRSSNRIYTIDDVASVIIDIELSLKHAVSPKVRKRLLLHYLYGYEYNEIAAQEDVTEYAIKNSCVRGIQDMAEWLETPKPIAKQTNLPERDETYKRKYASFPGA
ncbi:MAG TPA: hypothetical protein VGN15_13675 [Ktedonobacteraceae bacterium]|jgi:hypothetical protein|nr:hypothetical protein [Ktedonobacteraceae bacterium]